MNSRALELDQVTAGYGVSNVLRSVSLHVDRGELVTLLGPNGAGKSTTLLTISGLITPTSGSIRVLGAPLTPSVHTKLLVAAWPTFRRIAVC